MATKKERRHPRKKETASLRKMPRRDETPQQENFEGLLKTRMRIIGIGGGGSNIVSEISQRLKKADFVSANTDLQALKSSGRNTRRFPFGQQTTRGLGCGMEAQLGAAAALEDKEKIKSLFAGQDLSILIATLGGGTGSGASTVFAEASQEAKSLTIGIFTLPFSFEGEKRRQVAEAALEKLKPLVNVYVVIPNDAIFRIVEKDVPLKTALSSVNRKLSESLEGFIETLFLPGLINIDFADVRALLQGRGRMAYLSSSTCSGEERAKLALDQVLANALYDYHAKGAERILFNITGFKDMKMQEVSSISKSIGDQNLKAKIIFGISSNPRFRNKLRVTVLAIGCDRALKPRIQKIPKIQKPQAKESVKIKRVPLAKKKEKKEEIKPQEISLQEKPRRNALDVKKAIDEEIEELQEEERKWDTPAFLRYKRMM
ncbi:MAG: hypothetical protein HYS60_00840 [Candidatus Wildermuthbacteria bacterium]|nr:hypothetical protein [Candidatus Wildermuthbacteria bacterium]